MVKDKGGFSFVQYITACQQHANILKENRQSPENPTSLSRYLLIPTGYQAQVPTMSPSIDTSVKMVSPNLEFPVTCEPCKIPEVRTHTWGLCVFPFAQEHVPQGQSEFM